MGSRSLDAVQMRRLLLPSHNAAVDSNICSGDPCLEKASKPPFVSMRDPEIEREAESEARDLVMLLMPVDIVTAAADEIQNVRETGTHRN